MNESTDRNKPERREESLPFTHSSQNEHRERPSLAPSLFFSLPLLHAPSISSTPTSNPLSLPTLQPPSPLSAPPPSLPYRSGVDVESLVDMIWHLLDLHLKPALDFSENFLVVLGRAEGDSEALCTETARPPDSVEVLIGVIGHVVVHHDVHPFDVNTAAEQISRHHDAGLETFEVTVLLNTLLLLHLPEDARGRESAVVQELVEGLRTGRALHEDDDLIELKLVEDVVQFLVFRFLLQLHVVLEKPVEGQLRVGVYRNLHRLSHESLAVCFVLGAHCGREHHRLDLLRCHEVDRLNVSPHVFLLQASVALVDDEELQLVKVQRLLADQRLHTAGSADKHMGDLGRVLQHAHVLLLGTSSVDDCCADGGQMFCESVKLILDLVRELAGVTEDQTVDDVLSGVELLEN
mmetsp:Transcript_42036/g.82969  ORF Transcript_42036/g.82969 Transcript_42036/m.82969 type:complete len:407 (-) Transcript_42036:495-1715(-)